METRHKIAQKYGYRLRSSLDGDFLSKRKPGQHNHASGDDLMKIRNDGFVDVYSHDANAYFVARLIANTPK